MGREHGAQSGISGNERQPYASARFFAVGRNASAQPQSVRASYQMDGLAGKHPRPCESAGGS